MTIPVNDVAVVAIGRNEGLRLKVCLEAAIAQSRAVIYVDSGSSDASVANAAALGVQVIELDRASPFTAARARNEGGHRAARLTSSLNYIQFVDGDCELRPGWLPRAREALQQDPSLAAVCGRRRERYPERSIYNMLCELEWTTPVGEVRAFGGDVLIRASAFQQVGGYREDLIAGEDPELGVRLRAAGWRIRRLDVEMTLHDADMTRFGQWWRRCVRSGFAYAQGAWLHGAPPEKHWVHETRRAATWGLAIPLATLGAAAVVGPLGLMLSLIYPAQVARLSCARRGQAQRSFVAAFFLVLCKFPEAQGVLQFHFRRLLHRRSRLIEYK